MIDKEIARQQITALVEKFRDTPHSKRNSFSEQETREYFILPLFRALGWDTENPSEFSAEEQISRGFVDFGFYLNFIPAFYLETKKASEKLENPKHMNQAINYAFLKGVTWAVLTDFQQLMVFNAEWEETDPTRARFLNLQFEHYTDDQFDDLWLLSRPSFQERAIDRVAERFGKKSRKQPVTDVLFKQLTVWRRELFEQMRTYGRTLWSTDPRAVDNAVQKFLDRMIFIRTVEDRGVEPNQLRSLVRQANNKTLYANLLKLFRDLDAVYNSNLFAESETDRMEVHDPDLIREIVEGLYGDQRGFVNYDFNAITADVLGAVYEQYLGFKAQDPTGEQALDPRKQEKRKKQGIYYTPQFVVRYIVRQTLGKLLTPPPGPLPVYREGESETPTPTLPRIQGRELGMAEFVHGLRILDPACGSGSFLIEAFDVLDRWLALNGDETDRQFPRRRRLRILQENLYGVDLDEQAVEVTRLNLMLRAAIERDRLPLLTHIQHGNSLIDDADVAGAAAFKWEERFPEVISRGGFDVVIGNPPYGAEISDNQKKYFAIRYTNQDYQIDTYMLFIEAGVNLLKRGGMWGMIIPNPWMTNLLTKKLRRFMLSQTTITNVVHYTEKIFPDATVDTEVVIATKQQDTTNKVNVILASDDDVISSNFVSQNKWIELDGEPINIFIDEKLEELISKIDHLSVALKEVCKVTVGIKPYQTGKGRPPQNKDDVENSVYDAKVKVNETYRLYLRGKDINRYIINPLEERWLSYGEWLAEPRPSAKFDAPEKIFIRQTGDTPIATLDTKQYLCLNNMHVIVPITNNYNLRYILGMLNSRLVDKYYESLNPEKGEALAEVKKANAEKLPIRAINFDDLADKARHDRMVALVETMLRLKQQHATAEAALSDERHRLAEQIEHTDRQIDALVYALYGLTDEEIKLVEGKPPP